MLSLAWMYGNDPQIRLLYIEVHLEHELKHELPSINRGTRTMHGATNGVCDLRECYGQTMHSWPEEFGRGPQTPLPDIVHVHCAMIDDDTSDQTEPSCLKPERNEETWRKSQAA